MNSNEDYILSFHSIKGNTIKTKWQYFNEFLKSLRDDDELPNLVQSITAKTPLEEIFKIEIMMKFKMYDILLYELKTSNRLFIRKLLMSWRLFEEMFSNINAQDLIENILPYLSYSLKLKILNGIRKNVKNKKLLDEYFLALEGKYGLKIATLILPGCSLDLIKTTIKKYSLKLSQAHLKSIVKKDKQFLEFYFEVMKDKYENENFIKDYVNIIKYAARTDPNVFWKLHEKYDLKIKFGRHMTPNMIKSSKDFMQDTHGALRMFHSLAMLKSIKSEGKLEKFTINLYPETHDKFMETSVGDTILKLVRRERAFRQYELIASSFKQKYNRELTEFPDYFTENLLKVMPMEKRKTILDIKVKEDEKFFYLYEPSISLPIFKKHLQHSSDTYARNQYAIYLYQTCEANKDEPALLDVLRYCLNRHKNDVSFLNTFLSQILRWPNLINLSNEHWELISDLNKILEISCSSHNLAPIFFERYICYLIKTKQSLNEIIRDEVQDVADDNKFLFLHINDRDYQEIYYHHLAVCIDTYRGHPKYEVLCVRFLSSLCFQFKRKKIPLRHYTRFFNELDAASWDCWGIIKIGVTYDIEPVHDMFWRARIFDNTLLLWYAKHRPDKLEQHASEIFQSLEGNKLETLFLKLRKLCNPNFIENIKNLALDMYHRTDYNNARLPIRVISILAPEVFLDVITPLLPSSGGQINLRGDKEKVILQQSIAKGLSNIRDTLETFPLILRFCVGDYLKFGLPSLYSITYNTPELRITDCLKKLSNTAVSVRKHVLYLSRYLFTVEDFYEILKEWSEKEKNLSMRNIIMKKTMEFLSDNPSERIWSLLKHNLNTIDPDDREMYDFLLKLDKIPPNYLSEYLETIYKAISQNPDARINEKKLDVLNAIPMGIIKQLDDKFLKDVIEETVCKEVTTDFYWKCVFHSHKEKQILLFEENFQNLISYKERNLDLLENVQKRSNILNFVSHFLNLAIELKQGQDLVQKFIERWTSVFQSQDFKKDYMLLQFVNLYFESEFDIYQTGVEINKLLYVYVNKYDNTIIPSFCQRLHKFLQMISIEENDKKLCEFVIGLFHEKKDHNIFVVVTHFLPKRLPKTDNAYAKYIPILEAIKKCDIPTVQYHLDDYISSVQA